MHALETRPVIMPNPGAITPFHPETYTALVEMDIWNLPIDEGRLDTGLWMPTGFTVGGDKEFVGKILKDRFFHNPLVGYTFRMEDGMVVEYQYVGGKR